MIQDGAKGPDVLTGMLQAAFLKRMHKALDRSHSSLDTTGHLVPEAAVQAEVPIGPEWLQQQWQAERQASTPRPPKASTLSDPPAVASHSQPAISHSPGSPSNASNGRESPAASQSQAAAVPTGLLESRASGPHGMNQNAGLPNDRTGTGNGHVPQPSQPNTASTASRRGQSFSGRGSPGADEPAHSAAAVGSGIASQPHEPHSSSSSSREVSDRSGLRQRAGAAAGRSKGSQEVLPAENGVEHKRVEVVEGQPVASIDDMLQESHRRYAPFCCKQHP